MGICYNGGRKRKEMTRMKIIFGIFLAVIALIFLAVGYLALAGGRAQKKRCSACASGTVVRIHVEQQSRSRGRRTINVYTPEFRFNADGVTYSYRANFGSMRPEFKENQDVTVYYDPADPKFCYVAEDAGNSSQGGLMCLAISVLLGISAVVMFV